MLRSMPGPIPQRYEALKSPLRSSRSPSWHARPYATASPSNPKKHAFPAQNRPPGSPPHPFSPVPEWPPIITHYFCKISEGFHITQYSLHDSRHFVRIFVAHHILKPFAWHVGLNGQRNVGVLPLALGLQWWIRRVREVAHPFLHLSFVPPSA